MHPIYHTDAIVLGGLGRGESDKTLVLYTRDFGMIFAQAQGLRNLKSKLRFALQPYSIGTIDIIELKRGYRIGSARGIRVPGNLSLEMYAFIHRFSSLLRRLCAGSLPDPLFFNMLTDIFSFALDNKVTDDKIATLELVSVLRVLSYLGYLKETALDVLVGEPLSETVLEKAETLRGKVLPLVNLTLKETML